MSARPGTSHSESAPERAGEAVRSYRPSPGKVEVRLTDLASLFDRETKPTYPHLGPLVDPAVAAYLLRCARDQRRSPHLEVVVALDGPPADPADEASARTRLSGYFANEAELVRIDRRVNRTEGLAALRYAIPMILVAGFFAGLFYTQLGDESAKGLLLALVYLVFITVVWVMLWDPVEVLLFDSFFLRLKYEALHKLSTASVRFTYVR